MIIKSFKSFIDRGKIIYTYHKLGIKKFKVRQDGKVDVDGRVLLYESGLKEIPVKFGNVSGDFNCRSNYLRNLKNCPDFVGGDFTCSNNLINTLDFLPKKIEGKFLCRDNKLESIKNLENCYIGGEVYLRSNYINSLEGAPKRIFGDFDISWNNITNLKGCPEYIDGSLLLFNNEIETLSNFPKLVRDYVDISSNNIHNLDGIPENTNFNCEFIMDENPIWEVIEIFQDNLSKKDREIDLDLLQSLKEWDVIQGKNVIWDRLVEVFHDFEIDPPDPPTFENYQIIF